VSVNVWKEHQQVDGNSDDDYSPLFATAKDLYNVIDLTALGDVPWQAFSVTYDGDLPEGEVPTWMTNTQEVWYRDPLKVMENQIGNQNTQERCGFCTPAGV
jgi:hypothetical protein